MKLVIDIPEEAYKLLQTDGVDWLGAEHILNAVANGTPLPKHHGRLIDAEEACPNHIECVVCPVAIDCPICAAPTIIPTTEEGEEE